MSADCIVVGTRCANEVAAHLRKSGVVTKVYEPRGDPEKVRKHFGMYPDLQFVAVLVDELEPNRVAELVDVLARECPVAMHLFAKAPREGAEPEEWLKSHEEYLSIVRDLRPVEIANEIRRSRFPETSSVASAPLRIPPPPVPGSTRPPMAPKVRVHAVPDTPKPPVEEQILRPKPPPVVEVVEEAVQAVAAPTVPEVSAEPEVSAAPVPPIETKAVTPEVREPLPAALEMSPSVPVAEKEVEAVGEKAETVAASGQTVAKPRKAAAPKVKAKSSLLGIKFRVIDLSSIEDLRFAAEFFAKA